MEAVAANPARSRRWGRCGLLVNQASVDRDIVPSQIILKKALRGRLAVLFSPQHGLFADKQDNMVESRHGQDLLSGLPYFSLYSEVREPTDEMLDGLDTVIIDIQDVGTRVYTFIYTMAGIMRRCARLGKRVVVLDRPNPIGGDQVEGNVLEDDSRSFVGEYALPMRHGMTIGEIALWMNRQEAKPADLDVVRMRGWKRSMHWSDTGRTWVMTSPNMPTAETAEVYPGMVLLEGTNLSEGRGTTMPFLTIGAPYIRDVRTWMGIIATLCEGSGVIMRPALFEPTFHKFSGTTCRGVQWIIRDAGQVRPYQLGIGVLLATMKVARDEFRYKDPPYEYETVRPPIQLLLGSSSLPQTLTTLASGPLTSRTLRDLATGWQEGLKRFRRERKDCLLYS